MKRIINIAYVLLALIFAYSANATQAQEFKTGGGLVFGNEVEAIGI